MSYTLRDMSALIARCENRPEEPIFNQLKGLTGRGILKPVSDYYGKKGALLFPAKEVHRARMLLAAIDCGFASNKLAKFDAQMRAESISFDPVEGRHHTRSFDAAVENLSETNNNTWVFEVGRVRMGGELDFSGRWIVNGIRRGFMPDWSDDRVGFEGVSTFAFTAMCAPLWLAMQAEG